MNPGTRDPTWKRKIPSSACHEVQFTQNQLKSYIKTPTKSYSYVQEVREIYKEKAMVQDGGNNWSLKILKKKKKSKK